MRYKEILMVLLLLTTALSASKVDYDKRKYFTKRIKKAPIIDGKLDDVVWNQVEWGNHFTERDPDPDTPPSQQTKFKILYDEEYLYIGVRAYDSEVAKIDKRVCSRDDFGSDWIEVNIDSYNDDRTAFSFTSLVCGSQGDEYISNDGDNWDENYNPVWFNESNVDKEGWTTEYKIPFSQLRYADADEQVWGIQVARRIHRFNERSYWQPVPKRAPWVSSFGELHGLKGIKRSSSLELIPYNVWKVDRYKNNPDNKLQDGEDGEIKFGLDGTYRITNDLTATFTINPDFGQVEADPAELNLSAFENFQWERRPFFNESNDLFRYSMNYSGYDGYYGNDMLFYSRRIGRLPHGYSSTYDFSPKNTTILGAIKVTGKLQNGLNIGVLESITSREKAEWYDENGDLKKEVVEPGTNYFATRFSQNFNGESSNFGGMITSVIREEKSADELGLNRTAHTGGIDFGHKWQNNMYMFKANFVGSHITGSKETITNEQYSYNRYFQRPDADHLKIDENKESMTGYSGFFQFSKIRGTFVGDLGATFRSPELELNDIGYMRSADVVGIWNYFGYRTYKPGKVFKYNAVNIGQRHIYNTDFDWESTSVFVNTQNGLNNNWSFGGGVYFDPQHYSFTALEGGPKLRLPWKVNGDFYLNSPEEKDVSYGCGGWSDYAAEGIDKEIGMWTYINIKFNDKLRININPEYETDLEIDTYYDQIDYNGKTEYLFSRLEQDWWRLSFNANYIFKPGLSLKVFVSPYVVWGKYSEFKLIDDADNNTRSKRFKPASKEIMSEFGFDDSNYTDFFNYINFQANTVLKWEFLPGSTMYLVWTHSRDEYVSKNREINPIDDIDNLFKIYPNDIFLLKVSYWFNK